MNQDLSIITVSQSHKKGKFRSETVLSALEEAKISQSLTSLILCNVVFYQFEFLDLTLIPEVFFWGSSISVSDKTN